VIYLILDTNIWIYLSNGFDPLTSKHSDDLHFQLLDSLKKSKDSNEIGILVNEIIVEEWKRNREHCKLKIEKLQDKQKNIKQVFGDIDKYVKTDSFKKEYIDALKNEIKKNEEHIVNVEKFLINDCIHIKTSDEVKIRIFDLSVSNKAPFHNKSNNVADASILLSATEFLNENLFGEEDSAIFVSNNFKDFTDGKNKEDFHPEIKTLLGTIELRYQRVLPAALKLSQELIIEIQKYLEQQEWLNSISFDCQTPFCKGNENLRPWGYLSNNVKVRYENELFIDPNQLNFFPEIPVAPKIEKITSYGDCVVCGTTHIICPDCGELFYIDDIDDEFDCAECGSTLTFEHNKNGESYLHVIGQADEDNEES